MAYKTKITRNAVNDVYTFYGNAIIENVVYKGNESNRAYRRGIVNPNASLDLDDRIRTRSSEPITPNGIIP